MIVPLAVIVGAVVLFASPAVSMSNEFAFDSEWDIEHRSTNIVFSDASMHNEIQYEFDYTGTLITGEKYIITTLYDYTCQNPLNGGIRVNSTGTSENNVQVFDVHLDVIENEVIDDTWGGNFEVSDDPTRDATIEFCVRVDYYYDQGSPESVNFIQLKQRITFNMTSTFAITDPSSASVRAAEVIIEETASSFQYEFTAELCNEADDDGNYPKRDFSQNPFYEQGQTLIMCLRTPDELSGTVYPQRILSFEMQQNTPNGIIQTTSITDGITMVGSLVAQDCDVLPGTCVVRHKLISKFFQDSSMINGNLPNILISGVARVEFGFPGPGFRRRRNLREIPFRIRHLSEDTLNDATSSFNLEAPLHIGPSQSEASLSFDPLNSAASRLNAIASGIMLLTGIVASFLFR